MAQDPDSDLDKLRDRIDTFKERVAEPKRRPGAASAGPASGIGQGLRIAVEMVSAIAVGAGLGWVLDAWLGTKPVFFLIFFLLGAAAAFLNVYRIGKELERRQQEERRDEEQRERT